MPARNFHCIGHGIGAHVCAYVGNRVHGLGRISGKFYLFVCYRGCEVDRRIYRSTRSKVQREGQQGYFCTFIVQLRMRIIHA